MFQEMGYHEDMRIFRRELDSVGAFYLNGLLRAIYVALTAIFIPIYVYKAGLAAYGTVGASLTLVALYYIVQRVVTVLVVFPLSRFIEHAGFRRSISLSVILLIVYTIILMVAQTSLPLLFVSSVVMGVQIPLYWMSRDSALSQDIAARAMGTRMGLIVALENIGTLLSPFAGGAIIYLLGYQALFWVALVILTLSVVPLWWMPPHSHKNGVSLSGFWYFLHDNRYYHQVVANFGAALNDYGNAVIWPLALFFLGIRDEKLGEVYSLAALVTVLVQLITGRWFDRLHKRDDYTDEGVYGIATLGMTLSWVGRFFVTTLPLIAGIDMVRQLFGSVYATFFSDYLHLGGRRMASIAYWVYMEIVYSLGAIVLFVVMLVGVYYGLWKEMALLTAALWTLASIVIARESNIK
jgi:hypothetical protein